MHNVHFIFNLLNQSVKFGRKEENVVSFMFMPQIQSVCVCTVWIQCHNTKLLWFFVLFTRSHTTAGYISEMNRKATITADEAAFHNSHHNAIFSKIENSSNEKGKLYVQFNYENCFYCKWMVHHIIAVQRNVCR